MELNYSEFSIGSVFDEVKSTILPLSQVKSLEMDFNLELDIGIQADRSRLIQILYNLISNAVKFTPEGGKVSVYCKKIGNRAIFSVTDTGIGISSEDQKYLFEPFKQIDSGMNRQYGGTGLGLALVKQFVDLHKGRVWFTSVQGKGSSFIFELPVNGLDEVEKSENVFKDSATKVEVSANFSG
ncbi:cell wall metabolism sensor histidine kinase WalK [Methanosarcina barkeri]|uniref:sensor histidine kinase n=1 Tax=Methanosarcina barkeri TaxID=2208 RepID=UPI0000386434|nr:ATP-binding protein [Methanosarcina barkeri]